VKLNNVSLTNFTHLNKDDILKVLSWRNYPDIKKWMYTNQDISLDEHYNFIKELNNSNDKQYFLVNKDGQQIGVVYFTQINRNKKECKFGLYANPLEKIAGTGKILGEACIQYAFNILNLKTLKLEVFSDNIRAINLYKNFKFKETANKIVNNKNIICMELENENR